MTLEQKLTSRRFNALLMPSFRPATATIVASVMAAILFTSMAEGRGRKEEARQALRDQLLKDINEDRARAGLHALRFDPHASAVGDQYCRLQIKQKTTGHFTLDGLSPYMRYSFAGGNDGVSENAAAWSANYRFSDEVIAELTRRSHRAMMDERPPRDGHRRTILDPHATHVGIGLAWEGGELRMVEEFVRRYIFWEGTLPRTVSPKARLRLRGKPLVGYTVDAVSVHHEPIPEPMRRAAVSLLDTYDLPSRRSDFLPRLPTLTERGARGVLLSRSAEYGDGTKGDFPVSDDGSFSFLIPFSNGPGIYTVVTWVKREGAKESIAASNIAIRVTGSRETNQNSR